MAWVSGQPVWLNCRLPHGKEDRPSRDIEKALGRLKWATFACPLSRPFLQPFLAWKAATTT